MAVSAAAHGAFCVMGFCGFALGPGLGGGTLGCGAVCEEAPARFIGDPSVLGGFVWPEQWV